MTVMPSLARGRDAQGRYVAGAPGAPGVSAAQIEEQKRKRAREWRKFRMDFLYSQAEMAEAMGCSRRTIEAVESGEVIPMPRIQRAFRDLKRQQEREAAA